MAGADAGQSAREAERDGAILRDDAAILLQELQLLREAVRADVQVMRLLRAELKAGRGRLRASLNHYGQS